MHKDVGMGAIWIIFLGGGGGGGGNGNEFGKKRLLVLVLHV